MIITENITLSLEMLQNFDLLGEVPQNDYEIMAER